jgi:hypothetical protein
MKVLVVSNLDSSLPFGNFTRPFFLGRSLAELGVEVGNVALDPSGVAFGPTWRADAKPLPRMARAVAHASSRFRPDVIYAHEMRPALASLLARSGPPVVADFHSLPSVELAGFASHAGVRDAAPLWAASLRLRLSEVVVARRAHALVAAGDEVRDEVCRRYSPVSAPLVVPNGVDPRLLEADTPPDSPYEPGVLHAVSTLPNGGNPSNARALEFLSRVAGELDGRTPDVRANVLGSSHGPGAPLVRYHGVQSELLPWIAHADACLMPYPDDAALCGGARNKLLEFLARGRAVVTTAEGLRGLRQAESDPRVFVAAAEPLAFAETVLRAVGGQRPVSAPTISASDLSWRRHAPELGDWLARAAAT